MLVSDSISDIQLNWTVPFPIVTGFLAVWYLLPTPRRRSLVHGALMVVIAILGFGAFLWHGFGDALPWSAEAFLFFAFSLQAFAFGILMIVQRNPARSALFFAVVVLSVCGLFLLLAAPFLMAASIVIYAGAIIVTFLFVIMLAHQTGQTDANDRTREPSLAAAIGFILLGTLLVVLQRVYSTREIDELIEQSNRYANSQVVADELKDPARANHFLDEVVRVRKKYGYGKIEIPTTVNGEERRVKDSDPVEDLRGSLELTPPVFPPMPDQDPNNAIDWDGAKLAAAQIHRELSSLKAVRDGRIAPVVNDVTFSKHGQAWSPNPDEDPMKAAPRRLPSANIAALGRTLFTDHLLAIELGGTLLLVATIGAIAIGERRQEKAA